MEKKAGKESTKKGKLVMCPTCRMVIPLDSETEKAHRCYEACEILEKPKRNK